MLLRETQTAFRLHVIAGGAFRFVQVPRKSFSPDWRDAAARAYVAQKLEGANHDLALYENEPHPTYLEFVGVASLQC